MALVAAFIGYVKNNAYRMQNNRKRKEIILLATAVAFFNGKISGIWLWLRDLRISWIRNVWDQRPEGFGRTGSRCPWWPSCSAHQHLENKTKTNLMALRQCFLARISRRFNIILSIKIWEKINFCSRNIESKSLKIIPKCYTAQLNIFRESFAENECFNVFNFLKAPYTLHVFAWF